MTSQNIQSEIQALYETACQDLFVGLNCKLEPMLEAEVELNDAPIACIDAGSDELEIKIGLELPLNVLAMTFPVPNITEVKEEDLEDWASEMSNQLIGRLKTKLLRHNIEIQLGLPDCYFGLSADEVVADDEKRFSAYYSVDGQVCAFHLAVEIFVDHIDFTEEEQELEGALFESEIELF